MLVPVEKDRGLLRSLLKQLPLNTVKPSKRKITKSEINEALTQFQEEYRSRRNYTESRWAGLSPHHYMKQSGKFGVRFGKEESMPVWCGDCGPKDWTEKGAAALCHS